MWLEESASAQVRSDINQLGLERRTLHNHALIWTVSTTTTTYPPAKAALTTDSWNDLRLQHTLDCTPARLSPSVQLAREHLAMFIRPIGRLVPKSSSLPRVSPRALSRKVSTAAPLSKLSKADVEHFATILPSSSIISSVGGAFSSTSDDLQPYNSDWLGKYHGKSQCVLKPRTAQEVSKILKWCWEKRIAVVPQGGNTGLVGKHHPLHSSSAQMLSHWI